MQDWTEEEYQALRRLIAKAEKDPDFTPQDIEALKAIAEAFKGFQFFGRFSKWVIFILASIAGAITVWEQLISKVRTWLGS